MKRKLLLAAFFAFILTNAKAQQSHPVTEAQPIMLHGLSVGYNIKAHEVKAVGDKGNFSRYEVHFYVTNTASEPRIILYKDHYSVHGDYSTNQVVEFNCLNATGARLTSKSVKIYAQPCSVPALVNDKDCATNKTVQVKRVVQIGYWIKPGQTVSSDAILIVPLNEKPDVQAVYLAN